MKYSCFSIIGMLVDIVGRVLQFSGVPINMKKVYPFIRLDIEPAKRSEVKFLVYDKAMNALTSKLANSSNIYPWCMKKGNLISHRAFFQHFHKICFWNIKDIFNSD